MLREFVYVLLYGVCVCVRTYVRTCASVSMFECMFTQVSCYEQDAKQGYF